MSVSEKYFCSKCGTEVSAERKPCSRCGCISRDIKVIIKENLGSKESTESTQKRRGFKKFIKKTKQGWFPSRDEKKHPKGVELVREIDKEKNNYREEVQDTKTNEIFRKIEEPLDQHVSSVAKKKTRDEQII